tara:strand:+ start:6036 stop:6806 length:771 start_codon:yes stop_codon:yes gene_type:complete
MKILLSNDDGIDAEGINQLYSELKNQYEVFVVAPEKEMSGAGSSITTKRPLKTSSIKKNFVSVNGTPADCVHLALHEICPFKPDLLLSGINYGANMAEDLLYSGTVGAALEGREFGMPSIAISAAAFNQPGAEGRIRPNFLSAAKISCDVVKKLSQLKIDSQLTLNINVPNLNYEEITKFKLTRPGTWGKRNPPNKEITDSGKERFWITHRSKVPENKEDTDIAALARGEVSISSIGPVFLIEEFQSELKSWVGSL